MNVEDKILSGAYKAQARKEVQDTLKKDLLEEFELTDHPKADLLFSIAWEDGHSHGLQEVYWYFERYAELLK